MTPECSRSSNDPNPIRPAADVYARDTGLLMLIDLPGATASDLALEVEGRTLRVNASRSDRAPFERTFTLRGPVDTDAISAEFVEGVLAVNLPTRPDAQTRRIPITAQ